MKNILYIAPNPSVKGGISSVINNYLNTELSTNFNIYFVSSHVDGPKWRKLMQAILGLGHTIYYLFFKHLKIAHVHGSDIISSTRKYFYVRLLKFFKCKVIYHFHGASFMEHYKKASMRSKRRMRFLFEEVDLVICLSESWSHDIKKVAPEAKIQVIPNSVKLPKLYHHRGRNNYTQLTFLGLIGERKGLFDLLKVVQRLKNDNLKVKLSIGGNGEKERLLMVIEDLKINSSVEYLGWISAKQKKELLMHTDIFILPSYAEGMPMAILEAMSYSIPIISTSIGGIPEMVINGKSGYLVSPGDTKSLYEKVKFLILHKEQQEVFGQQSRNIVEEKYNIDKNIEKIFQIYNSVDLVQK